MHRRHLAAFALLGITLPLVAGASSAQQATQGGAAGSPGPAPGASTASPTASEIAARVHAFYSKAKTFKADFKQRYYVAASDKVQESWGSAIFERPGKMSWRYTSGNRIVSDGTLIKIYEPAYMQMFEQPFDTTAFPDALSFLIGQGPLDQIFKLTKLDPARFHFPLGHVLEGSALQPTASYERVFFYVDGQTFQVQRVIIADAQHNLSNIEFLTSAVNTRPPVGEFVFMPPRGTQVVRP